MVSESMPNICKPGCPGNRRICIRSEVPSCPPCPAMSNTLHHDIHKVIDTMGPPTPMFPLDIGSESADETTNSSTHSDETENNTVTNNSSNTSFVEVLIKNHHKSKKSKIIEEEVPKKSKSSINIDNSEVLAADTKAAKEVQFQGYASSALSSPVQPKASNKMEPQRYPSGIITGTCPPYPPCPHAPFPSAFYQSSNKSMTNGIEQNRSKQNCGNPQSNNKFDQDLNCPTRNYDQNINRGGMNRADTVYGNGSKDSAVNCMPETECYTNCKPPEPNMQSAELYYFDHGNAAYFHTTDCPPTILADYLAEKTENAATRFWAQIFGIANVAVSLFTTFILQFLRFILFSIVRPLTVGIIQIFSDYFLKPLLSSVFNGLIQPPLIFIFNILTSLRDIFEPIAHALGFFCKEIAVLFRACRLVEIKRESGRIV